jgi:hypothetical protein
MALVLNGRVRKVEAHAAAPEGNDDVSVFADRRARLLQEMAAEGLDVLLLYGNAWQNDYLRYATDFGILEGQALVIVREDGITLYVDSALEADRAALECAGRAAPTTS